MKSILCQNLGSQCKSTDFFILSRYMPGSKTPPQNSAEEKKLDGALLPVKARLVRAD